MFLMMLFFYSFSVFEIKSVDVTKKGWMVRVLKKKKGDKRVEFIAEAV